MRSEKIVEVLFRDGKPVRVSDQFGYGQVKAPATDQTTLSRGSGVPRRFATPVESAPFLDGAVYASFR